MEFQCHFIKTEALQTKLSNSNYYFYPHHHPCSPCSTTDTSYLKSDLKNRDAHIQYWKFSRAIVSVLCQQICHYHPGIHLQTQLFSVNFLLFPLNPRILTTKVSRRVVVSVIFLTNPHNWRLWLTQQHFLQNLNLQILNIFLLRINLSLTGPLILTQIKYFRPKQLTIFFDLSSGYVGPRLLLFNLCIEIRLWFITL